MRIVRLPSFCASLRALRTSDGLATLVGSKSVGIALGDAHALRAAACDLPRGHNGETEPRHVGALRAGGLRRVRARLALAGQFAERDRERLLLTLTPHRQFRSRAWRHAADLP